MSRKITANFDDIAGAESRNRILKEVEICFLKSASEGDLQKVRDIIEEYSYYLIPFNINCTDSLDRSALNLAIINGCLNVVEFLLNDALMEGIDLNLGDALFHAVECESYTAIELLLRKDSQISKQISPGTTSSFSPGLTPFMLAAHKNDFKILSMLDSYDHQLKELPDPQDERVNRISWDSVMERLLHYEARASPSYMLLMYRKHGLSYDPMLSSIKLYGDLMDLSRKEEEVSERYIKAAQTCEQFSEDLLQNVRSADELSGLMRFQIEDDDKVKDFSDDTMNNRRVEHKHLEIIDEACSVRMMDFVTSDNAQLALMYIYRGNIFRNFTGYKAFFLQIFLGTMFPILSVANNLFPNTQLGKISENPTVKYWSHVMSELVFISMLIANTIISTGRDVPIPYLLAAAYFWILGKLVQEFREIFRSNFSEYFSSAWNWNDLACIFCFTGYMSLRVTYYFGRDPGVIDRFHHKYEVYWYEERTHLLPISDMFIAVAYIFVFMRILELLRASRYFGPLQLSLDRMGKDTVLFLVLFGIFFFAFGTSITQLFVSYGNDMGCSCNPVKICQQRNYTNDLPKPLRPNITEGDKDCDDIVSCKRDTLPHNQFTHLSGALSGLFWTLFGYGNPTDGWLTMECVEKTHIESMAFIILGSYHIVGIIILMNMLIAMMSNSFQRTTDDSEREWKFHRTQLWLQYIHNDMNTPPPMNLIPNFRSIFLWFRRLKFYLEKKQLKKEHFDNSRYSNGTFQMINPSFESDLFEEKMKKDVPTISKVVEGRGSSKLQGQAWDNGPKIIPRFSVFELRVKDGSYSSQDKGDALYSQTLRLIVTRYIKQKSPSSFYIDHQ